MELAAQLAPTAIADDAGVRLAVSHAEFVGLDAQHVADWRARRAPFGMTPSQYRDFRETLLHAVQADKVHDLDVRLKGSAAAVFSGRHKQMPATWPDFVAALAAALSRQPSASEETDLRERLNRFLGFQPMPRRRPFDCMHKLQLESGSKRLRHPVIERRHRAPLFDDSRQDATGFGAPSSLPSEYGFLDDALVALAVPYVSLWKNRWTLTLGRTVAVKAFDARGPENHTKAIGELSSHFQSEDWILQPPRPGVD